MTNVVCFCGSYYAFEGDIGICPRCGEYTSFTRASPEEEEQMRAELELLLRQQQPTEERA
jgi:hypothetical protein